MFRLDKLIKRIKNVAKSTRVRIYLLMVLVLVVSLNIYHVVIQVLYFNNMLEREMASLQTSAAMIAGDYTAYETLYEAEKAGLYNLLNQYSAMDNVRYRLVDQRYVIIHDTYRSEYGRNIINSNVIKALSNGKSSSNYYKDTGTIESIVPVYGLTNNIGGVLVADINVGSMSLYTSNVDDPISVSFMTIVIIASGAMLIISSFIFKPYKKLVETVSDIANGHTQMRIDPSGSSEISHFASRFNSIMDKASMLDESRQEFVSNVSHELKTPITSIKVLADSLNMQEDVPVELYREFMQDITAEIDRESKIIEDLLSLVRMDKAAASMNVAPVNMNELVELVLKRLTPIADKKSIEILFESFRPVVAEVDEVKITQVISNLVENSIKYNSNEGWVRVSLNADYQYMYIRVEDSGIGIPKESQELVFDRFYRVDKARSRQTGGTGLGLAIVNQIILLHHGTIKLYSEEGKGTTFTVRIPLNYVG